MRYVRPSILEQEFLDADSSVIDYGHRWARDPDDDAYSVTAHPERFAPLHVVAHALIEHLGAGAPRVGVALRIDPTTVGAAPIEFTLTPFPGVLLRSGEGFFARFPFCGCDARDESVPRLIDELEETVLAIVAGGLEETARGYRLELASGRRGTHRDPNDHPPGLTDAQGRALTAQNWAPWPPSSTDKSTIWFAKDSRKLVKMSAVLSEMGGATLTTELIP